MEKEIKRLSRLISVLTLLQTKSLITATEISERYDISVRTVYRDIRALQSAGIPIYTIEGKGYSLMKSFKLRPISFSEVEANALITAEQFIANNRDNALRTAYSSATDKIRAVLGAETKEKTNRLKERMLVVQNGSKTNSDLLDKIQTAITDDSIIEIQYISFYKAERTLRHIEPKAIYHTNNNWILIAYCHMKESMREFRIDRIETWQSKGKSNRTNPFSLEQYFKNKLKSLKTPDKPLSPYDQNFTSKKMKMKSKRLIGIQSRTKNDGQAAKDIPLLWEKFMSLETQSKLPEKLNADVYCVYHDYESDHLGPYSVFLGYPVDEHVAVPEGCSEVQLDEGPYKKFSAKGNIHQNIIYDAWLKIWNEKLDRKYVTDYEIYDQRAADPTKAEVDIYIGLNK